MFFKRKAKFKKITNKDYPIVDVNFPKRLSKNINIKTEIFSSKPTFKVEIPRKMTPHTVVCSKVVSSAVVHSKTVPPKVDTVKIRSYIVDFHLD